MIREGTRQEWRVYAFSTYSSWEQSFFSHVCASADPFGAVSRSSNCACARFSRIIGGVVDVESMKEVLIVSYVVVEPADIRQIRG